MSADGSNTQDGSSQHFVPAAGDEAAKNRQAMENNNRWQASKEGLRSAQDIRDGDPNSPDKTVLEEPGHVAPNTSHGAIMAEPPEASGKLRLHEHEHKAAGLPAVLRSLQYVYLEQKAGLLRGTHGLLVLNQKHGIDCMSCAWPEPDGKRRIAEFCEKRRQSARSRDGYEALHAGFLRAAFRGRAVADERLLAGAARPAHAPDGAARRGDALQTDRMG